jgi:hypothetical protein
MKIQNMFLYLLGKLPSALQAGQAILMADENQDGKLSTEELLKAAAKAFPAIMNIFGIKVKDNPYFDTSEKIEEAIGDLSMLPLPQWLQKYGIIHD